MMVFGMDEGKVSFIDSGSFHSGRYWKAILMSFRKYKILESKTESALKTTLAVKDEKIAMLEAQVKDSLNLNQQLQNDLNMVRVVLHIHMHFITEQEQVVCTFFPHHIRTLPKKNTSWPSCFLLFHSI